MNSSTVFQHKLHCPYIENGARSSQAIRTQKSITCDSERATQVKRGLENQPCPVHSRGEVPREAGKQYSCPAWS